MLATCQYVEDKVDALKMKQEYYADGDWVQMRGTIRTSRLRFTG